MLPKIVGFKFRGWLCWAVCLALAVGLFVGQPGCRKSQRSDRASVIDQAIQSKKTKSDNLRDALRYLKQLTPFNREKVTKEVLVQLNTWVENVPKESFNYSTPALYRQPPAPSPQRTYKIFRSTRRTSTALPMHAWTSTHLQMAAGPSAPRYLQLSPGGAASTS